MDIIENRTFDEIAVGDTATVEHILTQEDLQLFAAVSGNRSPFHLDEEFARQTPFQGVTGPGMWGASLLSGLLGTKLPGPGTAYISQHLEFSGHTRVGDRLTVSVRVTAKDAAAQAVRLECHAVNQAGKEIFRGESTVRAPDHKIRRSLAPMPRVEVHDPYQRYRELIAVTVQKPAVRTAVVHPCDEVSLAGAIRAAREKLIDPVLVGPIGKIQAAAASEGADLHDVEIVDVPHSHAAAEKAAELARTGNVKMLMKGALHTDELMHAVVSREAGLRTARRITHCFVMDVPAYHKPLMLTDAAVNIQPDLSAKTDIVQNAIDMARVLGIATPKVAILSAVETINPVIPSTLEAAALCKMADRGQITGGILDGPLAFDNAISAEAARIKKIPSPVSGDVDVLVVPDLESGNMLFKQLTYLAGALAAGVVLGARVPVVLTSRADSELARLASCAVGMLLANAKATGEVR
jgi:phosphotransacetylase/acyl dehydratase